MNAADRRSAILSMQGKLSEELATLPGPDGPVEILIRELTGKQARDFEVSVARGADNQVGMLLQMSIADPETREQMFSAGDRAILEELGMSQLKPLLEIISKQSGLSSEDVEKAKASLVSGQ